MKKKLAASVVLGSLASACTTTVPGAGSPVVKEPARLSYVRLYCTPDNESRFETVSLQLARVDAAPPAPPIFAGGRADATRMVFTGFDPSWGAADLANRKFHPAPSAQWVVYLSGTMTITTTDNVSRRFGAGDVLRVEDVAPCRGHISVVGDEAAHSIIVR